MQALEGGWTQWMWGEGNAVVSWINLIFRTQGGYKKVLQTTKEVWKQAHICTEECLTAAALFPSAPLKMSETLFDGFEKMGKKQNKEQVPPPADPENKKPSSSKPSKKSHSSNTVAPATHKTLEEAFRAVSTFSHCIGSLFKTYWLLRNWDM